MCRREVYADAHPKPMWQPRILPRLQMYPEGRMASLCRYAPPAKAYFLLYVWTRAQYGVRILTARCGPGLIKTVHDVCGTWPSTRCPGRGAHRWVGIRLTFYLRRARRLRSPHMRNELPPAYCRCLTRSCRPSQHKRVQLIQRRRMTKTEDRPKNGVSTIPGPQPWLLLSPNDAVDLRRMRLLSPPRHRSSWKTARIPFCLPNANVDARPKIRHCEQHSWLQRRHPHRPECRRRRNRSRARLEANSTASQW